MKIRRTVILVCGLMIEGLRCSNASDAEEALKFRHLKPATVHFLDRRLAEEYQRRLRAVGCPATLTWHWGHTDLTYECAEWHMVRCRDHAEAMEWMKFFAVLCFEASHIH